MSQLWPWTGYPATCSGLTWSITTSRWQEKTACIPRCSSRAWTDRRVSRCTRAEGKWTPCNASESTCRNVFSGNVNLIKGSVLNWIVHVLSSLLWSAILFNSMLFYIMHFYAILCNKIVLHAKSCHVTQCYFKISYDNNNNKDVQYKCRFILLTWF